MQLLTWPPQPPAALDGLYAAIAELLGGPDVVGIDALDRLDDHRSADGGADAAVIVVDAAADGADAADLLAGLRALAAAPDLDTVVVVGDDWIGTDNEDVTAAGVAGAAVSIVRSVAVRRESDARPNIVCIPDHLLGRTSTQRGPLRQPVELRDVADAAAFLLGESGRYLRGQVLFVNGGRQLFSSLTA